jgi:hypothetical protein
MKLQVQCIFLNFGCVFVEQLLFVDISPARTLDELYKHRTQHCSFYCELVILSIQHLLCEGNVEGLHIQVQEIH